jgi:hypothetical protein
VDERSFRYRRYTAGRQLLEYPLGFLKILFLESACAKLEIPDRCLKHRLRLPALGRLRTSGLTDGVGY